MLNYINNHFIDNQFNRFMANVGVIAAIIHAFNTSLIEKLFTRIYSMGITDIASTFAMTAAGVYSIVRAYITYRTWKIEREEKQGKKHIIISEETE